MGDEVKKKMFLDTRWTVLTDEQKRTEIIETLSFCLDLIKCLSCDECSNLCSDECETQQAINKVDLLTERLNNETR